jgi:hypothetical protein
MIIDAGSDITVNGNFTPASGGILTVQLGGTAPNQYGKLTVTGSASLAGTLDVTLANGFTPASGDLFAILADASQSGTFDTVNAPPLSGGLAFHVTYDAKDVTLTVR